MRWDTLFGSGALFAITRALECSFDTIQPALPYNTSLNFAYPVQANGTFQVPRGDTGYPTSPVGLPALCAISVQVQSIGDTTFGFGLFLPDDWNGRFLAIGNGGFAGGINWLDMVCANSSVKVTPATDLSTGTRCSLWVCSHVDRYWPQLVFWRWHLGLQSAGKGGELGSLSHARLRCKCQDHYRSLLRKEPIIQLLFRYIESVGVYSHCSLTSY